MPEPAGAVLPPMDAFVASATAKATFGLAASLLIVAFLVSRLAPQQRKHVRSAVVFFGVYVVTLGFAFLARSWVGGGDAALADKIYAVALLFQHTVGIILAGVVLFHLVLPRVRVAVPAIGRDLIMGLGYVIAIGALLHRFGVHVSSLLASGAIVTVVLGLSLQATLGNVIGGVALQIDGSVREGDWVRLPDKTEGKVRRIRWRHTTVETRNGDTVVVPNAQLLAQNILILGKRYGEAPYHRMWVYFDIDFRTSPERVISVVESALRGAPIPCVASDPPPNCICLSLAGASDGRSSQAHYAVRYWLTDLAKDDPTSSLVNARVFTALRRANIPLAIPAATLFVTEENKERTQRKIEEEQHKRARVLAELPLFRSMTDQERTELAAKLRPAPFAAGEIVTRQGAEAHWLYIVASGRSEVRVRGESGEDARVALVDAPTIFGEAGLMTGAPRAATIVAVDPIECYRLDKDDFKEILQARPEMAEGMSRVLAERQVELEAVEKGLDAEARKSRTSDAHGRILESVKRFFGLDEEAVSRRGR